MNPRTHSRHSDDQREEESQRYRRVNTARVQGTIAGIGFHAGMNPRTPTAVILTTARRKNLNDTEEFNSARIQGTIVSI
jgi:hypothetical protein